MHFKPITYQTSLAGYAHAARRERLTASAIRTLRARIDSFGSELDRETNPVAAAEIRRGIALAQSQLDRGTW